MSPRSRVERRSTPDDPLRPVGSLFGDLRDRLRDRVKPAETPEQRIERLKAAPETEVVARKLASFETALSQLAKDAKAVIRERIERHIAELTVELATCTERDAERSNHPEGCICFGTGGVGACMYQGVNLGDFVPGWRVWCNCRVGRTQKAIMDNIQAERRRAAERTVTARQLAAHMQLPPRLAGMTFEGWAELTRTLGNSEANIQAVLAQAQDWIATDHWAVLHGPLGTGKTCLAAAMMRELALLGQTCVFVSVPDLLGQIRATFGQRDGGSATEKLIDATRAAEILLLDDAGAHYVREEDGWAEEILYRIVNGRYDLKRRTVLTTNLRPGNKLKEKLGERSYARLREVASFILVDGPDLRRRRPT